MDIRLVDIAPGQPVPEHGQQGEAYRLLPHFDEAFYRERTDRNIGWITREEQEMLRHKVVGIAGCGGMGGLLASIFVRLGIGEVRIADCEVFDVSNINRQFAAMRDTVGKSKAFETAREVRRICDDTTLVVYPQGICEETVDQFLNGCDVVCDEIEFWAVGSRILLHREARKIDVSLFNCNTVGHRTFLFLFGPNTLHVEEALGLDYGEACVLQTRIRESIASEKEKQRVMNAVIRAFLPEIPEYSRIDGSSTAQAFRDRLRNEGKASIIATNPPMASGFVANRVLLSLLERFDKGRYVTEVHRMPAYFWFDAAHLDVKTVQGAWW